jgi:hypothetical protein
MATVTNGTRTDAPGETARTAGYFAGGPSYEGAGWVLFAAIMFAVAATLNIIWGIAAAAVSNSHFFVGNASYILTGLNTWGWIAIGD